MRAGSDLQPVCLRVLGVARVAGSSSSVPVQVDAQTPCGLRVRLALEHELVGAEASLLAIGAVLDVLVLADGGGTPHPDTIAILVGLPRRMQEVTGRVRPYAAAHHSGAAAALEPVCHRHAINALNEIEVADSRSARAWWRPCSWCQRGAAADTHVRDRRGATICFSLIGPDHDEAGRCTLPPGHEGPCEPRCQACQQLWHLRPCRCGEPPLVVSEG